MYEKVWNIIKCSRRSSKIVIYKMSLDYVKKMMYCTKNQSRLSIKEDVLRSDDKKVKYYTGLPSYAILKVVFDFVCEEMPNSIANCKLSPFEQFVMTLKVETQF